MGVESLLLCTVWSEGTFRERELWHNDLKMVMAPLPGRPESRRGPVWVNHWRGNGMEEGREDGEGSGCRAREGEDGGRAFRLIAWLSTPWVKWEAVGVFRTEEDVASCFWRILVAAALGKDQGVGSWMYREHVAGCWS